jgi:serine/threonine protein kinase
MSEQSLPGGDSLSPSLVERIDEVCDRFEAAWKSARTAEQRPRIEDYLSAAQEPDRSALMRELLSLEMAYRRRERETLVEEEYRERFPGHGNLVRAIFATEVVEEQSNERTGPWAPERFAGPVPSEPVAPGLPIVSGYEILEELGRGGMGVVYKARQISLKRLVALKMIKGGSLADSEQVRRFRVEAEAVARLQHPHIVQIHDIGEYNGLPYFCLELMSGGSLLEKLQDGPLPLRTAAGLVEQLAQAMHYAHGQGVVHRDLKPANLLLAADGTVKITDFGLAKRLDEDLRLTHSEAILGTPLYMAPEQAWGKSKEVGPAADVYALGAILYELLTGRPPFQGETRQETYDLVRFENPVRPTYMRPEVPLALEVICLKCLAKKPHQRYDSAQALACDLRRFLADEPVQARPEWGGCGRDKGAATASDREGKAGTASQSSWKQTEAEEDSGFRTSDTKGFPTIPGYEIESVWACSGMGAVYKARQVSLNRAVALKMIRAGTHPRPEELARFRTEAASLARLRHPNIVHVYDFGEHNGRSYIVMEFVEGGELRQKLAESKGLLPPRQAAALMETLARALHHAHQRGIVHRDVKPANILLTTEGTPKIVDFGLVKQMDITAEMQGMILGTPAYMSPEQAAGKNDLVGPTSDVYGLGATFYEMLTGRPPFKAASPMDTVLQVVYQVPVPPRSFQSKPPRDLEAICLKCLQKEPARRYASAEALAEDLRRFLLHEPIRARRTPFWERGVKWARRRPLATALLFACALILLAAIWYL